MQDIHLADFLKELPSTRIVCTIGTASAKPDIIREMIKRGMSVARINQTHGTRESNLEYMNMVREVAKECGVFVGILLDLPGPKYRLGEIAGDCCELSVGTEVVLTSRKEPTDGAISVWPDGFAADAKVGSTILVDDAAAELIIDRIDGQDVYCRATITGELLPNKTVSAPECDVSLDYLGDETRDALEFARDAQPDFIGMSCIRDKEDVETVREFVSRGGAKCPSLVAKIEMAQVLRNLDSVVEASDVVMVARGDLGVEMPLEKLPMLQKQIIHLSNIYGKPVITATQLLESMMHSIRPTRAEVTDISTAVQQGTDALMLSGETAIGEYPVRAVEYMNAVAKDTENDMAEYSFIMQERINNIRLDEQIDEVIAYRATQIAQDVNAKVIVAFTESGASAQRVSAFKPSVPIIAAVRNPEVIHKLSVCRGVVPFLVEPINSIQEMFFAGSKVAYDNQYAKEGELIVIVMGTPVGHIGNTNLVRVLRVPEVSRTENPGG